MSLPDPFAAPTAGDPLTPRQEKAARAAAVAAARGDGAAADKQLAKLPAAHPVRRLIELEAAFVAGRPVAQASVALATESPGYASAWSLAALGAEREGRVRDALTSARKAAALRADAASSGLAARLEREVVAAGVAEVSALLGQGNATDAFAKALEVLDLVPGAGDIRVFAVRAALAAGQLTKAAEMVPALPDTPAALETKGRVAEALGQWELAVDFYGRLPADHPGRCELLAGAREQSRLSLAPPYVSRALSSAALTRRELAAIVVWEAPFLAEKASGTVPVFEDVVGLPEGRDIILAVRAGVLAGDAIVRRFGPGRPVSQRELAASLDRLAQAAGRPSPRWCEANEQGGECIARPATLDGKTVAGLVRTVAGQEESPCTRR